MRIAIDDFGTGYSSLAYLQRFPVDALKIDRSFISRVSQDPEGDTLIHTLVQLGKSLSIETLAEGIEQSRELSLLKEENCDSGQGFLFARPLDVAACDEFLQDWTGGAGAEGDGAGSPTSPNVPRTPLGRPGCLQRRRVPAVCGSCGRSRRRPAGVR